MTAREKLLEVSHLYVDYQGDRGPTHAVTDVSFTLHRGEILGLAGESGCGKSTLAFAIARLLRPPAEITGGQAVYHPHTGAPFDILGLGPRELRTFRWKELAIVFQSAMNSLNPVMTIGTQIRDVLHAHQPALSAADRTARAAELLKLVGIAADRLNSYPHELSGGMRQRAAIAIALALSPEIIIMDEPTTALDVVVQREILTEIMRLRDQLHFAVIFITHDLSLLLELADTIAIMYAGRMVEQGSQQDLYLQPRHPYSYGLINAFPTLRGPRLVMFGLPGTPPDLRELPTGCAFHPRCPLAFATCKEKLPVLQAAGTGSVTQQVACHLYDAGLVATSPTLPEIAASYAALAEGRTSR